MLSMISSALLALASAATVSAHGFVQGVEIGGVYSHKGPVIDCLASCNGNCSTVNKTTLGFFKIDEKGLDNGTWAITIPSSIAPGSYVLHHEIIALHGGRSVDGAQLYPFCIDLDITGTGTDVPVGTLGERLHTVTNPGILVNIYVDDLDHVIPGPPTH